MAAGVIPAPGTRNGPCEGQCEHRDCAANRNLAETRCALCPHPIGYDKLFYARENGVLMHQWCFMDLLLERERNAGRQQTT